MTPARRPEPLEMAEQAYALVQSDPFQARSRAEQALALARLQRDAEAHAAALHALGWARAELGDARALTTLRSAMRAADGHHLHERAARIRRNVAWHTAYRGNPAEAIREIELARARLRGIDRARSEVFRVGIYHLADRAADALPASKRALNTLRKHGDTAWEARLSHNRGIVFAELGDPGAARVELERARDLYATLGYDAAAADTSIELALLPALAGDPLRSLVELESIDESGLSDFAACWLHLNRAEALLELRLLPEARADLARFERVVTESGRRDSLNKVQLDAARLALAAGDPETAASLASRARRRFAARGQHAFAAASQLVSLEADIERGRVSAAAIRSGRAAVVELAARGWTLDALRGRLLLARATTARNRITVARRELVRARALERKGSVADRVELRHVEAMLLLREGHPRRAERRLRAGLDLLESFRGALGALEVRATTGMVGLHLARAGLRIALDSGNPDRVLAWAERVRGTALRFPAVRPPADRQLSAAQAELRALDRRIRDAEGRGRAADALVARRAELEAMVRARSRLARGTGSGPLGSIDPRRARSALGARALLEFVELDGRLFALTQVRGSLELHELDGADTASELEWLRFSLSRLARGGLGAAQAATLANARAAAEALDRMLVAPLLGRVGDAPLVVVPTGALHVLPWGALPSLHGRPITVAPSLSTWVELHDRRPRKTGAISLVAGPRLRHARREVRELAASLPGATVLTGKGATVEATLAALDGASLAHVACHGRFRADSPLFSSLELADGPLTALDLQRLRRAPDVLVLSACDVALSKRHPGDELLGLSAALIAAGTRSIVASVVPVPDAAARRLMLAFHRHVSGGASPAAALAAAQAALRADRSALAGFVCLGAG